jgi:dihydrofolate reductase
MATSPAQTRGGVRAWAKAAKCPEPPFRVPVFVLTHRGREDDVRESTTFHFVTDGFDAALARAREAAGEKDVALHGGSMIRQAIAAEVLDELNLQLVPVLLGGGRRLFAEDGVPRGLKLLRVVDAPGATHLKYELLR